MDHKTSLSTKIYNKIITVADKYVPKGLRHIWESPNGPKTIFFWAPLFKWGIAIASICDMSRPADAISLKQSSALAIASLLWTRNAFIKKPRSFSLCAVNLLICLSQTNQVARALKYSAKQKQQEKLDQIQTTT